MIIALLVAASIDYQAECDLPIRLGSGIIVRHKTADQAHTSDGVPTIAVAEARHDRSRSCDQLQAQDQAESLLESWPHLWFKFCFAAATAGGPSGWVTEAGCFFGSGQFASTLKGTTQKGLTCRRSVSGAMASGHSGATSFRGISTAGSGRPQAAWEGGVRSFAFETASAFATVGTCWVCSQTPRAAGLP